MLASTKSSFSSVSFTIAYCLLLLSACGGNGEVPAVAPPTAGNVTSVMVTIGNPALVVGEATQATAEARDQNGRIVPRPAPLWTVANGAVASVDAVGRIVANAPGRTIVTASVSGKSGTAEIDVRPVPVAAIVLSAGNSSLRVGTTSQVSATPVDRNGSPLANRPIVWRSAAPVVAAVDTTGLITALSPGRAVISATAEGQTSSLEVTVLPMPVARVEVQLEQGGLIVGEQTQARAVLRDSAGRELTGRSVSWTSGLPSVAVVDGNGRVTAVSPGTLNVIATSEAVSGSAVLRVNPVPAVFESISAVVPGRVATVRGRGLSSISSITVDGVVASDVRVISSSEVQFIVPQVRSCETDGRTVSVSAHGVSASLSVRLTVPSALSLAVGESLRLDQRTVSCIQLRAGDEDYVFSIANLSVPPFRTFTSPWPPAIENLATFRTGPGLELPTVVGAPRVAAAASAQLSHDAFVDLSRSRFARAPLTNGPAPLDPRYASAGVGDTVRFPVAYRLRSLAGYCNIPRQQILGDTTLSYDGIVVATSGRVAIAVDMRMANAPSLVSAESRALFSSIARQVDLYGVKASRAIFDVTFTPMSGGGDRTFIVITTPTLWDPTRGDWFGIAGDLVSEMPQAGCPVQSEMHTVFINGASFSASTLRPITGFVSAVAIHELAHQAEWITQNRKGLTQFTGADPESWATAAEGIAMHLAMGQWTQARYDAIPDGAPVEGGIFTTTWGRAKMARLWEPGAGYSQGALFALFMRELAGEIGPVIPLRTMWEKSMIPLSLLGSFDRALTVRADALGTTGAALVDRFVLASITDDLVDAQSAAAQGLPQFKSWDMRGFHGTYRPPSVSRSSPFIRTMRAGPGGYDAVYMFAQDSRGISLEFVSIAQDLPLTVRVTRLR